MFSRAKNSQGSKQSPQQPSKSPMLDFRDVVARAKSALGVASSAVPDVDFRQISDLVKSKARYLLPMVAYAEFVKKLTPAQAARLQGDLAILYVYRQDQNSVSVVSTRHSSIIEKFPEYHPMNIWRTSNSGSVRLFWLAIGLVVIPIGVPLYLSFFDYLSGIWTMLVAVGMFAWLAKPVWNFARDMSMPQPIWVLRVNFDGEYELCDYASEYIEGAYSTEYAARVAESTALRKFLQPRFTKDKGLFPTVPKTLLILAIVALVGIYLIYTSPPGSTPEAQPPPSVPEEASMFSEATPIPTIDPNATPIPTPTSVTPAQGG